VALLSFNVGVEAGQVVFVVICLGLAAAATWLARHLPRLQHAVSPSAATTATAYVLGTISVFWLFERMAGFA
jgi:hypothetical protein